MLGFGIRTNDLFHPLSSFLSLLFISPLHPKPIAVCLFLVYVYIVGQGLTHQFPCQECNLLISLVKFCGPSGFCSSFQPWAFMNLVCSFPLKGMTLHFWRHRQDAVVERVQNWWFGIPSLYPWVLGRECWEVIYWFLNSWEGRKQLQAKTDLEMSVLDCSLILQKLREYNAFPIPLGTE